LLEDQNVENFQFLEMFLIVIAILAFFRHSKGRFLKNCVSVGMNCMNEMEDQGRSYLNSYVNISNCFFSPSIQFVGNGGVIFVDNLNSVFVSYTTFYNCGCTEKGGAI